MTEWLSEVDGRKMLRVACPHCSEVLNSGDGDRNIKVQFALGDSKGNLLLSAMWDDFSISTEDVDIADGDVVEMLCTKCGKSLSKGDGKCTECQSSITTFAFNDKSVEICNRRGCTMHTKPKL